MLMAIDAGNTNTVFAVFDDEGKIRGEWRAATMANRTADETGVWLATLLQMEGLDRRDITAAIIASVVPATLFSLRLLCRRYFGVPAQVIGTPDVDIGIEILLDRPEEVGADRLVNAVGAFIEYGGPKIIVDFGTATTFDVIDDKGNYLGGAIAPGVNLSIEALHKASAQLPRVAIGRPERVIGKNTVQAIRAGIFWGYLSMIEGLIARIRHELGTPAEVIATGGLAPLFAECSAILCHSDPDLTLKGLYAVHRRNQAQ
ncbi:Type III pantothenate kinase [Candidatus Defluviicoccus seviourii]|uniref:Type III pantothenate kinase n=2 Tax=root TaxID=1 RepID=A0A564WAF8_9PROT|nr:Type III pantothenate kinase [uncultured Defluviicoccus sp.]VUX44932.1 Type III pantothenate kinase [Candidatus Defluviicoccus seviourii]